MTRRKCYVLSVDAVPTVPERLDIGSAHNFVLNERTSMYSELWDFVPSIVENHIRCGEPNPASVEARDKTR